MEEQMVNVAISKELWKEVGIKAIIEGVDKKEIVRKALEKYLEEEK